MFCKIVSPSSDIHKLPEVPKTFDELQRVVLKKFSHEIPDKFSLKYKDSDEDLVTVSNDDDLQTAILTNQSSNVKTLRVFVVPQTETQPTQGGKTGPRAPSPAINFPEKSETQQKPEIRVEEPYIGQLDYISSDPGKGLEENADLRTIYEQLPPMLDFKRSVSHNPQLELERNKDKNVGMKYFGKKDFLESPIPGIHSPMLQEENLLNEYFNEMQMKTIMNAVEKKVKEQIEEKIKYFSDQIIGRFQEEMSNPGFFRGGNPFGFKGMSNSFAPRMNMRINRGEGLPGEVKICKVCGVKMTNIIYNCLVCRNNFMCCENCENNVAHEHPLLKIRLSRETESYGDGNNTQVDYHGSTSGISNETFTLLNMLKRTSSYIESQSKMGTSTIGNRRIGTKNTPNTNNTDDVMQPLPSLARAHTSNYVGKTEKEQGNTYNFGYNNNDDHTNNKVQHKTPINTGTEPTNLGSPGTQSSSKMITYKIALVKPPIYEVTTVRAGYPYNVSFTIKNNGDTKWPETAKLVCIEGAHKGSDIGLPSLNAGTSHTVDLHLEAPWELGRFFNEWKVHYTRDGVVKSFGKEISIEIDVIDGDKQDREKTKKEKHERADKNHHTEKDRESKHHKEPAEKNTVLGEDQKLMKEFGCSEQTLKHARVLQDLMCTGSLKEKIEFINSCKKEWDLNQIVSAYLSSPSKLKDMMGSHATPL